mgnify:CR=1 FL=1
MSFPIAKSIPNFNACSLNVPSGVRELYQASFIKCRGIENVVLPESLDIVCGFAFYCCPNLKSVKFLNPDCDIFEYWDSEYLSTICNTYNEEDDICTYNGSIICYEDTIASEYVSVFGLKMESLGTAVRLGDVNNDRTIDAMDASAILTEYAVTSTGKPSTFNDDQRKAADVNSDSQLDARDASLVLTYYVYTSTGHNIKLADFV